jgi:hypothetical protein
MYYDWEFIQAAMEDHHYVQKTINNISPLPNNKFAWLAFWADRYSKSDNSYIGKNSIETLRLWIESNLQGCADWLND